MSDEMRMLYQIVIGDIEFSKKQQWATTNYGLLLYAATYAVATKILPATIAENISLVKSIFYVICIMVFLLSYLILNQCQASLESYRSIKDKMINDKEIFSDKFRELLSNGSKKRLDIYSLMIAVILIGCLATMSLIYFCNLTTG